jgi:hypothetical protein
MGTELSAEGIEAKLGEIEVDLRWKMARVLRFLGWVLRERGDSVSVFFSFSKWGAHQQVLA